MSKCQYCWRLADDVREVELRPDGENWSQSYASKICGRCREYLHQSRQFRYVKRAARNLSKGVNRG